MSQDSVPFVIGLVSGSHVVNHSYMLLFAPAFPLLRSEFGVSLAAVGLAIGVVNVAVTGGQLPLGYLSDTYSHTAVLVGSLVVGTIGCILAALAPSYEWLLVSAIVMGLGAAGHHPAHYPLISASTTDDLRSRAYSVHGFAGVIGLAVPFAVVPASVALGFGWREAFAAIAVGGAAYTVFTIFAVRRIPNAISHAGSRANSDRAQVEPRIAGGDFTDRVFDILQRIRGYVRTLTQSPMILLLTALWFVNSIAIWGIRTYSATLLNLGYGLSPEFANTAASAMLVIGAIVLLGGGYLADRFGPMSMLFVGYSALIVLATVVGFGGLTTFAAIGVVAFLAATIDLSRPARATLTDRASQRSNVGKNFALITIGASGGGVIAPPVFGYVIESVSVGAAFFAIAGAAALALLLSVSVGRVRTS